jgi:hypothetical protein
MAAEALPLDIPCHRLVEWLVDRKQVRTGCTCIATAKDGAPKP